MTALILSFDEARRDRAARMAAMMHCPACGALGRALTVMRDGSTWYRCSVWPHPGGDRSRRWRITTDRRVFAGWTGKREITA